MAIKIPAGTRMYLTKKIPHNLYIQPDTTLLGDNLYVAYDVKIDGQIIIPIGIRVQGDWITESNPTVAAQLQVNKIYLSGTGQIVKADSDIYEELTEYNSREVENANHLHETLGYRSTANIYRRIIAVHCKIKVLNDDFLNLLYIEIPTKEIPVTFIADVVICPLSCM